MLGFLHHKSEAGTSETGAGGDKHHLMIWLTVGVLVIGFLTYKRMAASSSASPTVGYAGNTATGSSGGDGIGGQAAFFNQELQALQDQISANQTQFETELDTHEEASAQAQTAWDDRLSGLNDTWHTITNDVADTATNVATIGTQTAANTQTLSGISQSQTSGQSGLNDSLRQQLAANGERITDVVQSTTGGMLYLTNKGGVYADNGANYFGSYLGYANTTSDPNAERAGHGDFSQGHISALANGNYEIFNNVGEGYTFNSETKSKGY